MTYTDEQLVAIGKQAVEDKTKRVAQIKLASAKRHHYANECVRIVKDNELDGEVHPFTDTIEDYK